MIEIPVKLGPKSYNIFIENQLISLIPTILKKEVSKKNIKNDLHDDFKKYSKKQLNKKIENAIEAENYELAARLRDEINTRK